MEAVCTEERVGSQYGCAIKAKGDDSELAKAPQQDSGFILFTVGTILYS